MRYRPVVIKMMKHDMAMNADFLDTFQKEAKTVSGFNHKRHSAAGRFPCISPARGFFDPNLQRSRIRTPATAYEMVTGQRPFPENDLLALMDMHLSCDFSDPADFGKSDTD
jgi:hypothetical protein